MKIGKNIELIGAIPIINPTFRLIIIALSFMVKPIHCQSFKYDQLKYPRVRAAYNENYDFIDSMFQEKSIDINKMSIFLRAIKSERKLELYANNKSDSIYILIKSYDFCFFSGELGPKREEGDMQIPEGFYHIDRFNPSSYFFLSIGISYPNISDRKLANSRDVGGDIFIHGDCVSIGCIPLTDKWIKELYVICVEAKNNGQSKIPVHLFPFRMEDYVENRLRHSSEISLLKFWDTLVDGYNYFEVKKQLPKIKTNTNGSYQIQDCVFEISQ
ncbi:MAG: L,D-transpeptidase family protein [Flavobacteriales bacterium]|nr:L,D-transpeptidase family protein [Flavobacteriales bacterium]